LPSVN